MHYEINVNLNGKHFFATAERSLTNREDCKRVFEELKKRFSAEDGFNVEIIVVETYG